jgi:hypothetical protein
LISSVPLALNALIRTIFYKLDAWVKLKRASSLKFISSCNDPSAK